MSKHRNADNKLVSRAMRKAQHKSGLQTPSDNSAPQISKPGTNSQNQYR